MLRIALPVCLVLILAPGGAWSEPTDTATDTTTATPTKLTRLSPNEKLALAWLGQIGGKDAAKAASARRHLARLGDEHKLRPLAAALRVQPARLRIFAAGELARLRNRSAVRPLLARVVREPDRKARHAMVDAIRELRDARAVHALGRALNAGDESVRRRAAESLGRLGDELAYGYLIVKWEARSGNFPRGYISQTKQIAYLSDFDVEVA